MALLIWLVFAVLFFTWAGAAAGDKGHTGWCWALAGLCFGPFALLAVIALPDLEQRRILRLMAEHQGVDFSGSRQDFLQQDD